MEPKELPEHIKSRYAKKILNLDNFKEVSISNKDSNVESNVESNKDNQEPGVIFVPYIITTSGPSKEYTEFKDEYRRKHALCPKCGSEEHMSTLMGFIVDMDRKEEYKDLNRCTCMMCGDVHTAHDRISLEEFNRKISDAN